MITKKTWAPYLFLSPYIILFALFTIFPIGFGFWISFNHWTGFTPPDFAGITNYVNLVGDPRVRMALLNTLIFMAMIIPFQIIGAFLIANVLNSTLLKWRTFFRTVYFLPFLTTAIAIGVIFAHMFGRNHGVINHLLTSWGIVETNINWTGEVWLSRFMISAVTVWRWTGYTAIIFLAGLMNINPELYEAASIDGATRFQRMMRITLPLMKNVRNFVVITTVIGCFGIFEEPLMIFENTTGITGGPQHSALTGMWLFFDTAFSAQMRYGYASAIAFAMFVFIVTVTFIITRLLGVGGESD